MVVECLPASLQPKDLQIGMRKNHAAGLRLPHLRALPAFAATARTGSLTRAAAELCVTPGAVSRQVKMLEESVGAPLFRRRHNAVELTEAGSRFLVHVTSALAVLAEGARAVTPERSRLVVGAPITFARRWLIPRIKGFTELFPDVDIAIRSLALGSRERADVEIGYARTGEGAGAVPILKDRTIAVCSPRLLGVLGRDLEPDRLMDFPILLDTEDAWSWRRWCAVAGCRYRPRGGSVTLDTDEAAIDACLSGLGVGQASPDFVENELRSGQLIALHRDIAADVGVYAVGPVSNAPLAAEFQAWLRDRHF